MLIIEGADLVGKTTLCHKLAALLPGYIYQHLSRPPKTGWSDIDYIHLASVKSVRDRFHLSELAYSVMRKDESLIKEPRILDAELVTRFCAYKVVIVAEAELIKVRYESKDRDEMYKLEQVQAVNETFRKMSMFADHRLVCTARSPWVTDAEAKHIADLYMGRRMFWDHWKGTMKSLT